MEAYAKSLTQKQSYHFHILSLPSLPLLSAFYFTSGICCLVGNFHCRSLRVPGKCGGNSTGSGVLVGLELEIRQPKWNMKQKYRSRQYARIL